MTIFKNFQDLKTLNSQMSRGLGEWGEVLKKSLKLNLVLGDTVEAQGLFRAPSINMDRGVTDGPRYGTLEAKEHSLEELEGFDGGAGAGQQDPEIILHHGRPAIHNTQNGDEHHNNNDDNNCTH